jgi:uncharacterized protein (TIGR04222 family)
MSTLRLTRLATLVAIVLCIFAVPVSAQEDSKNLVWERFDVNLNVQPDGRMLVTETQRIRYLSGQWENGGRTIPLGRVDRISGVQVSEVGPGGQVTRLATKTAREGDEGQISWRYSPAGPGDVRTFRLQYTVDGVVRVYEDNQQLRWIAVPDDRRFPIEESTVTLQLPSNVSPQQLKLESYPERLRGQEQPRPNGALYRITDLPAFEGFDIRAQFPAGTVPNAVAPSWQAEADRQTYLDENVQPRNNVILVTLALLIPVLGLVGLLTLWFTRGKDPGVGRDPEAINSPPSDLPAPLAGVLLDEQADVQDVVSTILSLAERGVITITQKTNEELLGSTNDFELRLNQPYRPEDLRPYERTVVDNLFSFGQADTVMLSEARGRFMAAVPAFKDQLYDEVARAGLFRSNPERTRRRYRSLGTGLVVLAVLFGCVGSAIFSAYADPFFIVLPALGLAAVGIGLVFLSRAMPVRTLNGAVEASRWRSFRNYLARIERTPDIAQDKGAFERYLSYATAFNLGRSWLQKFSSVGTPVPAWYRAAGGIPGGVDLDPFGAPIPGPFGGYRRRGGFGMGPVIIVPPFGGGGEGPHRSGGAGIPGGDSASGGLFGGDSGLFDFGDNRGVLDRSSAGLGDLLDQASDAFGGGGWGGGGAGGFGGGSGGGGADFS